MRAKALLVTDRGPLRVDLASGRVGTSFLAGELAESRLVVIGTGLKRDDLDGTL